jgi:CheY-like chemotaxis protein
VLTTDVASGRPGARMVVLVVDDEAAARGAYVRVLERAQFETCEADNARAALQILTSRLVHAVILDQNMPGMSGTELTAKIRALHSYDRTPILFVSGDGSPEVRIRALQDGATDFMVKPVVLAELVARVEVQLRLNAVWRSTVSTLSRRAETVAALADLNASGGPAAISAALCRGISEAEDGAPVGIYESRSDGTQILLGSVGDQPSFISAAADRRPPVWLRNGTLGVPWENQRAAEVRVAGSGLSWGCAPLRRGVSSLGVLVLGRRRTRGESGDVDQLLAAAVEYAAVAAMHLGSVLTEARTSRETRDSVDQTDSCGQVLPVFRPIVNLRTRREVGWEATSLLSEGAAMADSRADAELATLSSVLEGSKRISGDTWLGINLSPSTLLARTSELLALIVKSRHPLVVELTDYEPSDESDAARSRLAQIGPEVRVAVRDPGTSLASLHDLLAKHPQFLKLDRSRVDAIEQDDGRRALVAGLVQFVAHTGTEIIAQGIETIEEMAVLRDLGIPFGEGPFMGDPLTYADLT